MVLYLFNFLIRKVVVFKVICRFLYFIFRRMIKGNGIRFLVDFRGYKGICKKFVVFSEEKVVFRK